MKNPLLEMTPRQVLVRWRLDKSVYDAMLLAPTEDEAVAGVRMAIANQCRKDMAPDGRLLGSSVTWANLIEWVQIEWGKPRPGTGGPRMTIPQVAAALDVHETQIRRWIKAGLLTPIESVTIGAKTFVLFDPATVDRFREGELARRRKRRIRRRLKIRPAG